MTRFAEKRISAKRLVLLHAAKMTLKGRVL